MINILVPTDFSGLSKVAIKYAIRFANKIDGNVTLLHVVTQVDTPRAGLRMRFQMLEKELLKADIYPDVKHSDHCPAFLDIKR